MIKTVKVKKQLRLDELIKYIWENNIKAEQALVEYKSNTRTVVTVDFSGQIAVYGAHLGNELFTVEVEEEITEDTALVGFQEVFLDKELRELKVEIHAPLKRKSINDVLEEHYEETECLQIYAKVNGKLQLVWEAE